MRASLVVAAALAAVGCGPDNRFLDRSRDFGSHVARVKVEEVPVHGHHVVVVPHEGRELEGELLAVDAANVYVLDDEDRSTVATRWDNIEQVRVRVAGRRPAEPAGTVLWTVVGTVSTISHGLILVATAPVWLAVGIPTAIVHGQAVHARVTPEEFRAQLPQFARYPQGMPVRAAAPPPPGAPDGGS